MPESAVKEYEEWITREFNRLWYRKAEQELMHFHYRGVRTLKCPMDLMVVHELIQQQQPCVIIETGTHQGGSAMFLRDQLNLLGWPASMLPRVVITIDVANAETREHLGIQYVRGSSIDPAVLVAVRDEYAEELTDGAMVILDSDHHPEHVLAELRLWTPLVPVGGWCICEDTNVAGHPVDVTAEQAKGEDPWAAVEQFLAEAGGAWVRDPWPERFLMTWNPSGYLKRVR